MEVSKLEYLKRYMDVDGSKKEKKLKKRKKLKKHSNIKIIDDSISFRNVDTNLNSADEGEFDLQEEKPILLAEDGSTIITKEYTEKERLKKERWNPLDSSKTDINNKNNTPDKFTKKLPIQKRLSPPQVNQWHDSSDNDMSPVHKKKRSPRISQRHDSSDNDMSPVRQKKRSPRMSRRQDSSDNDMSPARPPADRHDTSDSDVSPVRRNPRIDSDQDLSPARQKRRNSDDDLSPLRVVKNFHRNHEAASATSKRKELLPEVLSTGKAGLRTGAELREENEVKRKHELEVIKNLDADVSGKGAQTVRRDRKSGKKIDLKLEAINKRKDEEEKLEHDEKYAKWGKGVAQGESYQQRLKDDIHEMEKPLARYKDDKDLDVLLRERDRDGDPMLAFISKTKNKEEKSAKPRYSGPTPPPNRFNILPGYRFDGVDRSNGFEKRRFLEINKVKTYKDAAYKWSVEEM